jgi:acetyl/propionyl-CoA carboxylase alpha subunit
MRFEATVNEATPQEAVVSRTQSGATLWLDGRAHRASLRPLGAAFEISLDDRVERIWLVAEHDTIYVHAFGRAWTVEVVDPIEKNLRESDQADVAKAPMPGAVISAAVGGGEPVTAGQQLMVIESMKMQSEIVAWRDGVVEQVHVVVGDSFDRGAPLVSLIAQEEA